MKNISMLVAVLLTAFSVLSTAQASAPDNYGYPTVEKDGLIFDGYGNPLATTREWECRHYQPPLVEMIDSTTVQLMIHMFESVIQVLAQEEQETIPNYPGPERSGWTDRIPFNYTSGWATTTPSPQRTHIKQQKK